MAVQSTYLICDWILDRDWVEVMETTNKLIASLHENQLQNTVCTEEM